MTFTLISASAGSGKTHTLTHEIADRIEQGLRPSQLIATTFTRKAASELVDRVHRTLLEAGRFEDAQGVGSALIGTVNSVAGRLVREFALDVGISPDVQELDDDRQKAAFSAAIDEAAAEAGARASDLLARTEHDGEEDPARSFGTSPSWRAHVRDLAIKARTNGIGAAQLRAAAETAWEEYREAAGMDAAVMEAAGREPSPMAGAGPDAEPGADRRPQWLAALDRAIDDLRADLEASVDPVPGAGKPPIAARSLSTVRRSVEDLERIRRILARGERAPWSLWAKLAAVADSKANGGSGGYAFNAAADRRLAELGAEVADGLLRIPALQEDARALIVLVMETAATSLDAYARYKDELGLMDFVDQEVLALRVLRESERARQAVRSRFRLLAVDEFQDTSPIQLALFLELATLVEDLLWVGDPKQAIYGFRDADPELMLGILDAIGTGTTALGTGRVEILDRSWRSQDPVLGLVNTLFPRIFRTLDRERVVLEAAEQAVEKRAREGRAPGRIEAWVPQYGKRKSQPKHALAIADGVLALLEEDAAHGVGPEDVAVLVRTNTQAQQVVDALADRGIPASGEGTPILTTREGRILRAALAVTLDGADTLALTELVDLLADHPAHAHWFAQLAAAPDREGRAEVFASWWQADVLAGLRVLREECISLTPVEMITALSDALDLPERIRAWSVPDQRLRTLDALRRVAGDYAEQARSASAPITLTGLRTALDATDRGPDLTGAPGTVWVGTVHAAKGLEWSRAVVMQQDAKAPRTASGTFVVPAAELDVMRPLDGRSLRYWPDLLPRFAPLQDGLSASAHALRRARSEREESGRLQYVALTRAADVTILSGDGTSPVLDALLVAQEGPEADAATPEPVLRWEADGTAIRVQSLAADGTITPIDLPATIRRTAVELDDDAPVRSSGRSPLAATDLPPRGLAATAASSADGRAPADGRVGTRFQASGVASDDALGSVLEPVRIGPALVERGGQGWERVGEAVHGYLALPLRDLDEEQRLLAARRLVRRWSVERSLGAERLVEAGRAWHAHLDDRFPGAVQLTEQPITWWNEDAQVMEGWIDALLRLPDDRVVLVDHKSFPGEDPVAHVREHYLGQMDTYAQALAAAGRAPDLILMHLPLRGEVLEVRLARQALHQNEHEDTSADA
ncbi:UvrD-helicase domain-containing protein [Brachybacterium sp. DNPG3]